MSEYERIQEEINFSNVLLNLIANTTARMVDEPKTKAAQQYSQELMEMHKLLTERVACLIKEKQALITSTQKTKL